jgi:ABC-type uncharacterized transport system substrate-binding protein
MPFRILAVAIGNPANSVTIIAPGAGAHRPYIDGLIHFLGNPDAGNSYRIRQDYYIDYFECYEGTIQFSTLATVAPSGATAAAPAVIFCMSTPIVRYAEVYTQTIPIVGVFSDPVGEGFDQTQNICGVNAQRIQNGWSYYDTFRTNYPKLKYIYVLNRVGSTASEKTLANIKNHAPAPSQPPLIELDVTNNAGQDMVTLAGAVTSDSGLLVLPVDVFFANADAINDAAKKVKVFWPAKEFAKNNTLYYGASQTSCGSKMGKQVQYIFDHIDAPQIPMGPDRFVTVDPD